VTNTTKYALYFAAGFVGWWLIKRARARLAATRSADNWSGLTDEQVVAIQNADLAFSQDPNGFVTGAFGDASGDSIPWMGMA
jgi:hypothetical protein